MKFHSVFLFAALTAFTAGAVVSHRGDTRGPKFLSRSEANAIRGMGCKTTNDMPCSGYYENVTCASITCSWTYWGFYWYCPEIPQSIEGLATTNYIFTCNDGEAGTESCSSPFPILCRNEQACMTGCISTTGGGHFCMGAYGPITQRMNSVTIGSGSICPKPPSGSMADASVLSSSPFAMANGFGFNPF